MNLTIANKDYKLYFGLDFIAHLDDKYYIEQNGFKLGQGLTYAIAQIELANPIILPTLIKAGTVTTNTPKEEDIKNFIENETDIEVLMEDFLQSFAKSPTTRFAMKKLGKLTD
ncbi:MAG: tail assembly chaperone [Defluviitaleaceae bacterium]|nr:tail assembly chaperone [Defluviitaleaceae bacterium]